MNQKAFSVLFCALLASTFYHELAAKEVVPHQRRSALKRHDRAVVEQCSLECSISVDAKIQVYVNASLSLVGAFNSSANTALVIDVNANLTALFDGNAGVVFLINLSQNVVIKVSGGALVYKGGDFSVYFQALGGLSVFLNAGASVSVSAVSSADLALINSIVLVLVGDVSAQIKIDAGAGLALFIRLSVDLILILKANNIFFELLVGVAIFNLLVLVGRLKALVLIFVNVSVQAALSLGKQFSFAVFLTIESGANALLYLTSKVLVFVGIDKFVSVFENLEVVLAILISIAGPKEVQIVLVLQVLLILILAIKLQFSIEVLVQLILILIALVAVKKAAISIQLYLELLVRVGTLLNIAVFINFVNGLLKGTFNHLSVDIGAIFQLLVGVVVGIELVIRVLAKLAVSVFAIAIYLLLLVIFSTSAIGVSILGTLGIVVSVGVFSVIQALAIIAAAATLVLTGALSGILAILLGPVIAIFRLLGIAQAEILAKFQALLKGYFFVLLGVGSAASADVAVVKSILAQINIFISKGGAFAVSASGYISVSVVASGGVAVGF